MQHQIQQVVSNVVLGLRIVQQTALTGAHSSWRSDQGKNDKKANMNTYDIISSTKLVTIGSFTL